MVGFGERNEELARQIAPFLLGLTDNLEHELHLYIAASVVGEPEGAIDYDFHADTMRKNIEASTKLQDMLLSSRPVYASQEDIYEVVFDGYVLFMERDESYTTGNEDETCEGTFLVRFSRSRLLGSLGLYTFADDSYPGPLTHYGVYCEDHLVDVVTSAEPRIRKLSAEEIAALGFGSHEG